MDRFKVSWSHLMLLEIISHVRSFAFSQVYFMSPCRNVQGRWHFFPKHMGTLPPGAPYCVAYSLPSILSLTLHLKAWKMVGLVYFDDPLLSLSCQGSVSLEWHSELLPVEAILNWGYWRLQSLCVHQEAVERVLFLWREELLIGWGTAWIRWICDYSSRPELSNVCPAYVVQ